MKRLLFILLLLSLVGCGEEDEKVGIAPYIAGLDYSPKRLVSAFGVAKVNGWFWFSDPEGDFQSYRIYWNFCGTMPAQQELPAFFPGTYAGKMEFTWMIDPACPPGDYYAAVTALDSEGNESNPLFASFNIRARFLDF